MENHTEHPLTLTVEQAAKLLGIGRSTAYELVHTGDIPSLRLGRRIVVPIVRLAKLVGTEPAEMRNVSASSSLTLPLARTPEQSTPALLTEQPTLFDN